MQTQSKSRTIVLLHALLIIGCGQQLDKTTQQPNILLIMCDDLGWGDVGFNGNKVIQTPHLDGLAADGIVFSRFYAACPVCSPTRASCITGRSPYRMGIPTANAGHLPEGEITLPEILKDAGYATGHFGKWHLGTLTKDLRDSNRGGKPEADSHYSTPASHGYDRYFCTEAKVPTYDPMLKPILFDTAQGESLRYGWKAVTSGADSESYGTRYWSNESKPDTVNVFGGNARIIMDRALPFIKDQHEQEKLFFATIWFHTPHLPLVASEADRQKYRGHSLEEQLHYGSITAMDAQIGRLIDALKSTGQLANTLLFFCSDNGPEDRTPGSSGPYRERKRSLYEGGVRVPAFVYGAGITAQEQAEVFPIFTSDYLPTIVDLLDIQYPEKDRPLDGMSVAPLFTNGEIEARKPMGFQFHAEKRSWVTGQHKLISTDAGVTFELYDLLKDPAETNDIISENVDIASQMKADLRAWMDSCNQSEAGQDY